MLHQSHATASLTQEQALPLLKHVWDTEVVPRLPTNLQQQAEALEVFERKRAFPDLCGVLRGLLASVLGVYSFKQLGMWALLIGLTSISDTAWRHWLLKASPWLEWLVGELLAVPASTSSTRATVPGRIVLSDATPLSQPGRKGSWRLHQADKLGSGRLCQVEVTDRQSAASLEHFALQPGDIVVADQAYGYRSSVALAQQQQACVVLRSSPRSFPLLEEESSEFEVLGWLQQREAQGQVEGSRRCGCEWKAQRYQVRLIVHQLSEVAAEKGRQHVRATARTHGYTASPAAVYLAGWLVLVTTLSEEQWSTEEVLRLYRARWQSELFFKRRKSIAELAQVRCMRPEGVQATIRAWLVAWLLQEEEQAERRARLEAAGVPETLEHAELAERPIRSWTLSQLCVETVRRQVLGYWTYERVQACQTRVWRYVRWSPRQKRRQQETTIRDWLAPESGVAHPPWEAVA